MRSGQYLGIKFILGITSYSWWCRCVCVCVCDGTCWLGGGGGGAAVITNVIYPSISFINFSFINQFHQFHQFHQSPSSMFPSISSENKLLTRSKHCIAMTVITVTLCNSVALCNNYFEICETLSICCALS